MCALPQCWHHCLGSLVLIVLYLNLYIKGRLIYLYSKAYFKSYFRKQIFLRKSRKKNSQVFPKMIKEFWKFFGQFRVSDTWTTWGLFDDFILVLPCFVNLRTREFGMGNCERKRERKRKDERLRIHRYEDTLLHQAFEQAYLNVRCIKVDLMHLCSRTYFRLCWYIVGPTPVLSLTCKQRPERWWHYGCHARLRSWRAGFDPSVVQMVFSLGYKVVG